MSVTVSGLLSTNYRDIRGGAQGRNQKAIWFVFLKALFWSWHFVSPRSLKNGSVTKVVPLMRLSGRLIKGEVGRGCKVSEQCFPNVKMPTNALESCFKCRFWVSRSELGPQPPPFWQVPGDTNAAGVWILISSVLEHKMTSNTRQVAKICPQKKHCSCVPKKKKKVGYRISNPPKKRVVSFVN